LRSCSAVIFKSVLSINYFLATRASTEVILSSRLLVQCAVPLSGWYDLRPPLKRAGLILCKREGRGRIRFPVCRIVTGGPLREIFRSLLDKTASATHRGLVLRDQVDYLLRQPALSTHICTRTVQNERFSTLQD